MVAESVAATLILPVVVLTLLTVSIAARTVARTTFSEPAPPPAPAKPPPPSPLLPETAPASEYALIFSEPTAATETSPVPCTREPEMRASIVEVT